jgi:putative ABC transport system permease protein
MLRISWRNVSARFGRIILTSLAIIASTAFLSGTFIFRDTIERTFDALFADAFEDVDAYVQSSSTVETAFGFEARDKLPIGTVEAVAAVPGVADAQAFVQGDAVVIGKDGDPITQRAAPSYGSTLNSGELSVWKIIDGRAPAAAGEVALDRPTARDQGFAVGDDVKVNAEGGSRTFELVGIAEYDELSSPANATWALFDAETASEFVAKEGFVDAVLVKGDGSLTDDELADRIQGQLDPAAQQEALTGLEITEQTQTEIEKGLSFFTIFLSLFSFIALGVGCFVIYNVFSISAAQRRRENALLRAVGASRRQVTRMMLAEAVAVGFVGSVVGLLGGIGLAIGIRSLLDAFGFGIPAKGLALESGTIAITMIAGIVTTLVAAIVPAIASGRVAPVAAMSEVAFEKPQRNGIRSVVAGVFILLGIGAIGAVVGGADGALLGVAVVAIFVGVLLLGPVMANPIATVLGAPVQRFRGVTGAMARSNVQRNPKRTARTAAPVLIGVALVTGATVFASSIKTQLRETIGSVFIGEYVINSSNGGALSFSQAFVDRLNELPEVGDATGLGFAQLRYTGRDSVAFSTTADPATATGLLDYDFIEGSFAELTPDGVLVSTGEAQREEIGIGSRLEFDVGDEVRTLTVQGIYRSDELAQARVVHRDLLENSSLSNPAPFVFMTRADGVSDEEFRVAVDAEIEAYGIGELQDRDEFIDGRGDIIDQTLSFIYGLLGLSVIIAIFGIVLTMLLAVYERRRETGLLRAVGMTRAQVRTTVRWESVLTSLYGAVVGVVLGLVLGYVVIVALRDRGLDNYTVPVTAIAVIVAVAFVVGVLAAVIPARRATRFDILHAIAADG